MIVSADIVNFQSHPDTHVDFTAGLNALTGTSRSGKSTIRRALVWCIKNEPDGTSVVSWWNKKKDKVTGETRVTIKLDNGRTVARVRSPNLNGYVIDGDEEHPLEAIGRGAPPEIVQEIFNMADVNMSGQFDAPYLVSQSAGYVAQYLNEIIKLESADYFQKEVESRRRKCVTDTEDNNKNVKNLREALLEFAWLDQAETIISRIKARESKLQELSEKESKLSKLLGEYEEATEKREALSPVIESATEIIARIKSRDVTALEARLSKLEALQDTYVKAKAIMDIPMDRIEFLVKRIQKRLTILGDTDATIDTLTKLDTKMTTSYEELTKVNKELKLTQREIDLVDICPLCGSKRDTVEVAF